MWESDGPEGDTGTRGDPDRELAPGTAPDESGSARAALRGVRRQVLEALADLSELARRRSHDARVSAAGQRALAEAERAQRGLAAELVRDARWPGSLRDARIVLRMVEVAQRELAALRTQRSDAERAAALLAELRAALRRAFLSDREVDMD